GLFDMDDTMGTGITGSAFLRGEPYNCANTEDQAEAVAVPGSPTPEAESLLVIPMIAGDHRLGAIDLWRDGAGRFSELEVERAALFGYVTAAAWRNAQLYEELESRAMTDTLTGLLNIRWWHELAPREAAQSLRGGAEIGVLMVDLDHFKVVNDQCGHSVGDQVLRNVAGVLRSTLRSGDAALRYGGEEFLLVLRDTDTEGAIRVAESVRTRLSELESPGPGISRITASIGIAFYPRHGSELDDVVQAADMAMYKAKEAGRNRVVLAPEPSPALVDD
ncbi:MAG TPA: sensor domain-containing diguanylate cyclase, partial [Acidimicrobiales bacterium]|nr:sensor domain-containing diguanylate cyclase [Acidimicrobiales bacterium]